MILSNGFPACLNHIFLLILIWHVIMEVHGTLWNAIFIRILHLINFLIIIFPHLFLDTHTIVCLEK